MEEDKFTTYEVVGWRDDEEGEGERVIDTIQALTEAHAKIILRNGIYCSKKYPKGSWLAYYQDGRKIELDLNGRIEG